MHTDVIVIKHITLSRWVRKKKKLFLLLQIVRKRFLKAQGQKSVVIGCSAETPVV